MTPFEHALSSAAWFGGRAEDYFAVHAWLDESKVFLPDFATRALRHHMEGALLAERLFGPAIATSTGRPVATRLIAEQHIQEDLGRIPTAADWLERIAPSPWMLGATSRAETAKPQAFEPQPEAAPAEFFSTTFVPSAANVRVRRCPEP